MNLESLITSFGYPALFVGVAMEGETVVIIAGFMAHRGYLYLPLVMLVAFSGAFMADQFFFQVGKRKGAPFLDNRPHWLSRIDKVRHFLVRYQVIAILSYRFLYGMRTITPVVIGMSGFNTRRFVVLNLCSTLLWAVVVSTVGFYFGHALDIFLKDVRRYELTIILLLAFAAGVYWVYRYWLKRK